MLPQIEMCLLDGLELKRKVENLTIKVALVNDPDQKKHTQIRIQRGTLILTDLFCLLFDKAGQDMIDKNLREMGCKWRVLLRSLTSFKLMKQITP